MALVEGQFYAVGRSDSIVPINVIIYENGAVVVTAEDEHITEHQFRKAVADQYPGFAIRFEHDKKYGYYRADFRAKTQRGDES